MPSGDGRWLRDGDEIHSPVPGSPPVTINQSAVSTATHTWKRTQCLRFFSVTPRRYEGHHIRGSTEGRATKRTAGRPADRACQPPIGFRNAQRFGSWNQAQHLDLMAHPAAVLATATWPKGQKSGLPRCCKRCFVRRGCAVNYLAISKKRYFTVMGKSRCIRSQAQPA